MRSPFKNTTIDKTFRAAIFKTLDSAMTTDPKLGGQERPIGLA